MRTGAGLGVTTPCHRLILKVAGTSCVVDNTSGSHLDALISTGLSGRTAGPRAPFCGQQRATAGFLVTRLGFCQTREVAGGTTASNNFSGPQRRSPATGFCATTPTCPLTRSQRATFKVERIYYTIGWSLTDTFI